MQIPHVIARRREKYYTKQFSKVGRSDVGKRKSTSVWILSTTKTHQLILLWWWPLESAVPLAEELLPDPGLAANWLQDPILPFRQAAQHCSRSGAGVTTTVDFLRFATPECDAVPCRTGFSVNVPWRSVRCTWMNDFWFMNLTRHKQLIIGRTQDWLVKNMYVILLRTYYLFDTWKHGKWHNARMILNWHFFVFIE